MQSATTTMSVLYVVLLLLLVGLPTMLASSTSLTTVSATYSAPHARGTSTGTLMGGLTAVEEMDITTTTTMLWTSMAELLKESWSYVLCATTTTINNYLIKPTTGFLAELYSSTGMQGNTTTDSGNITTSGYQIRPGTSNAEADHTILLNDLHRTTQNSRRALIKYKALKASNKRMVAQESALRLEILNLTIKLLKEQEQQVELAAQLDISKAIIEKLQGLLVESERASGELQEALTKESKAHEATKRTMVLTDRKYQAATRRVNAMERINNASVCINVEQWSHTLWELAVSVSTHPGWSLAWLLFLVYRVAACLGRLLAPQWLDVPFHEEEEKEQQHQSPIATHAEEQASGSPQAEVPQPPEAKQEEDEGKEVVADGERESVAEDTQTTSLPSLSLLLPSSSCSTDMDFAVVGHVPLELAPLEAQRLPGSALILPEVVGQLEEEPAVPEERTDSQHGELPADLPPLFSPLSPGKVADHHQVVGLQPLLLPPQAPVDDGEEQEEEEGEQEQAVQAEPTMEKEEKRASEEHDLDIDELCQLMADLLRDFSSQPDTDDSHGSGSRRKAHARRR